LYNEVSGGEMGFTIDKEACSWQWNTEDRVCVCVCVWVAFPFRRSVLDCFCVQFISYFIRLWVIDVALWKPLVNCGGVSLQPVTYM